MQTYVVMGCVVGQAMLVDDSKRDWNLKFEVDTVTKTKNVG